MRHGCWATPLALLFLLSAAEAHGQTFPRAAGQSYFNTYRGYYGQPETQPSPSDIPAAPMEAPAPRGAGPMYYGPPPAAGCGGFVHESCDPVCAGGCYAGNACGCNAPCSNGCCCPGNCPEGCPDHCPCGCQDDEPWRLFGDIELIPGDCCRKGLSIFIGGWISGGITGNDQGIRSGTGNFPVPFNQVSDGFIANQAPYLYMQKEVDTGGNGFDWGFRVDYLFGTDGPDTQAFGDRGWDFGWNSSRDYGSAIPQLYAEFGLNNWSLKLGHFYTIIGYEVVPAPDNFFYSHAYTMNYGEPFTHTGGLLSYTPDDVWTFYGGYTYGWDSGFENRNEAHTFLGGVSYAWEEIGTLAWMVNAGDFGDGSAFPGAAMGDIYMNSLVAVINLTDNIEYVFQHDLGINSNIPGAEDAEWYGINQYLFLTLTDAVRLGGRVEWFDDDDGARVAGAAGNFWQYTLGLNVAPSANFRVRPELRWDKFSGDGSLPFANGTEDDLFTAGVDAILLF